MILNNYLKILLSFYPVLAKIEPRLVLGGIFSIDCSRTLHDFSRECIYSNSVTFEKNLRGINVARRVGYPESHHFSGGYYYVVLETTCTGNRLVDPPGWRPVRLAPCTLIFSTVPRLFEPSRNFTQGIATRASLVESLSSRPSTTAVAAAATATARGGSGIE